MGHTHAIYMLKMTGCSHCAAAMPALRAFARKHPAVYVETYDIASFERTHYTPFGKDELPKQPWPEDVAWAPNATPTYVLVRPGQYPLASEGGMSLMELERFVFGSPRS